jgi:hypothetical protein
MITPPYPEPPRAGVLAPLDDGRQRSELPSILRAAAAVGWTSLDLQLIHGEPHRRRIAG